MRKFKIDNAYELLSNFTKGHKVTKSDFETFIDSITDLPQEERESLKKLTPGTYIGIAPELAKHTLSKH